jgi:WD40 repeat protein
MMRTIQNLLTTFLLILLTVSQNTFAQTQPKAILAGHTSAIFAVAFSPDGTTIATGSSDNSIRLWDSNTGEHIKTLEGHTDALHSVAFSPDGKTLISGDQARSLLVWDLDSGKVLKTLKHSWVVKTVDFSPDGKTFASGDWFGGPSLKLWNTDGNELVHELQAGKVNDITFSSDGKYLASGGSDGNVRVWDPDTGELLHTFSTGMERVSGVVFVDKGSTLVCGGSGGIQIWDVKLEKRLKKFPKQGDPDQVECLALNPDGRLLASGRFDSKIHLWDLESAKIVKTLEGHVSRVNSVAFSPDGRTLVSGGQIFDALLWETKPLDNISFRVDPKNKVTVLWGNLKQR